MRQAGRYEEAVRLLADLRALAARRDGTADFQRRLLALRETHWRKEAFLRRLRKALMAPPGF